VGNDPERNRRRAGPQSGSKAEASPEDPCRTPEVRTLLRSLLSGSYHPFAGDAYRLLLSVGCSHRPTPARGMRRQSLGVPHRPDSRAPQRPRHGDAVECEPVPPFQGPAGAQDPILHQEYALLVVVVPSDASSASEANLLRQTGRTSPALSPFSSPGLRGKSRVVHDRDLLTNLTNAIRDIKRCQYFRGGPDPRARASGKAQEERSRADAARALESAPHGAHAYHARRRRLRGRPAS
jgi:hypothetical protein